MTKQKQILNFGSTLVSYLIKEYFNGDAGRFSKHVQYPKQQVDAWCEGRKPQKATIRWLLSATIAPEFRVATEFAPVEFKSKSDIRRTLRTALKGHDSKCGVYSFYDSMCNVLYVGKASSGFLAEMYQQLRASLDVAFPKAIKKAPSERWQAVRYVSAYEVPRVDHLDYPKHVEALVLRLSKPVGNKVLGNLNVASPPREASK